MAVIQIYACGINDSMSATDLLPSPTSLDISNEQIWSEDTGRGQSGENVAQMIGKSIAGKKTYNVKWGILTTDNDGSAASKMAKIQNSLSRGFFKFGVSTASVPAGTPCYRSEIQYSMMQAGKDVIYKDVSVSIIEK